MVALQLVDLSKVIPEGIIKDVLIKVVKFVDFFNFIILDFDEYVNVPDILEHVFIAINGSLIDVREGNRKMQVNDKDFTIRIYKAFTIPLIYRDLYMITEVKKMIIFLKIFVLRYMSSNGLR